MKTVAELCKPRESVFVDTTRDDVLNLTDLIENRIDPDKFFDENFQTKGMELLFSTAFSRFQGKSAAGVIRLTQAMGGGKTHNMLALALLSKYPDVRKKVLKENSADIGSVRVIAFSGRESDAEFGIWGSLAEQLGEKEKFNAYYSPLRAPGESAWINLLKGEKTLILLDELPPYLENARSISVGNSDLCQVTVTALSNLFSALGKVDLANVCLVFSDLKATYESGSQLLQSTFKELDNEANRIALNIEPVALNSDEIYDILKKRLFDKFPAVRNQDVDEVALQFKESVSRAGKSGLTNYSPDKLFCEIRDSYPFHPSIKDLYARFKENQGFQQTRGLIRLMRQVIRQFYESKRAEKASLINVFDFDLNNQIMLNMIKEIKPSLDNAINHDIAQHGKSVAESIDDGYSADFKFPYAQMLSKLILISSLNETAHGLQGLNDSEILGYLCEPGVDMNQYKKVLEDVKSLCWYLKMDNRGRYFFQNTKNMVANMNSLVDGYSNESARKELCKYLESAFAPKMKNCYELLYVMPAIDDIVLDVNKVALIIYEPYVGSGIHPDLKLFYDNSTYKNRIMFLTGQRSVMEKLYTNSKRLTAIRSIISEMKSDHISETDQQYREALSHEDKAITALLSTIRETFITLWFPTKNGLTNADFKLEFSENKFNGEDQIVRTLSEEQKFYDYSSDDRFMDNLRKKCEQRIFTQKEMTWQQILSRAATETNWSWYMPIQMDDLKKDSLNRDKWREVGGYIQKGPFEKEPTEVVVDQLAYDWESQEFTLRVHGIHGDVVYFDIGAEPTEASFVANAMMVTKETDIWFRCYDTTKDDPHPTGDAKHFIAKVALKHEQRGTSQGNVMELKSHPLFEIKYTTDGSNPKESGGTYAGEFILPDGCKFVRVAVYNNGNLVEEKDIPVDELPKTEELSILDDKPLSYTFKHRRKCSDTAATYNELAQLQQIDGAFVSRINVTISEKGNANNYLSISTSEVYYDAENLQATVDLIRESAFEQKEVVVEFDYKTITFTRGENFKKWVDLNKIDMNEINKYGDVRQ